MTNKGSPVKDASRGLSVWPVVVSLGLIAQVELKINDLGFRVKSLGFRVPKRLWRFTIQARDLSIPPLFRP